LARAAPKQDMNYRHAFHAGNFADVFKHAIFCRVLTHLAEKPAAYRVVDTHAGAGLYDLEGPEAERTGEWREGIGRLREAVLEPAARDLLAPYLDAVSAFNPNGALATYPGSPALALHLMRPQDRLIANEAEPGAATALARALRRDDRARALTLDGWTALNANIPPKERRGVVLVDPPFEQPDERERLVEALASAHRKWPTGIYLLWYPVKAASEASSFSRKISALGIPKTLRVELIVPNATDSEGLRGTGIIAANPPWRLHDELQRLLPVLARVLARGGKAETRLEWIVRESPH
jgi:23S rRNA (adenine2030-N6)-methyltransferase